MASNNSLTVFVPTSLDGVGAFLVSKWFLEQINIDVNLFPTNINQIARDYKIFKESFDYQNADKIYVVGGYLAKEIKGLLEGDSKATVFTLKEDEFEVVGPKFIVGDEKTTNYTELLHHKFKNLYNHGLSENKNLLLNLIEDYTSYNLKYGKVSIGINILFRNFQGNRLIKFVEKYKDGFGGFTDEDKKIINFYNQKIEKTLNEPKFVGDVSIGGEKRKVVSIFGDICVNELAAALINKYKCDVAVIVNTTNSTVNFRRSPTCKVNLKNLAAKLCDGDGKEYAASGKITENFLNFTKLLVKEQ